MSTLTIIDDLGITSHIVEPSRAVRKLPSYGQWLTFLLKRNHAHTVNQPATMGYTVGRDLEGKVDEWGHHPLVKVPTVVAPASSKTVTLDQAPPTVFPDGSVGIPCIACGLLACPSCGIPGIDADSKCCTPHTVEPTDRALMKAALASSSRQITALQRATMRLALQRQPIAMRKITVGCRVRMEDVEQTVETERTVRTIGKPVSKSGLACRACVALFLHTIESTSQVNKDREALADGFRQVLMKDEQSAYTAAFDAILAQGKGEKVAREIAQIVLEKHRREVAKSKVNIPGPLTPILDVTEFVMERD